MKSHEFYVSISEFMSYPRNLKTLNDRETISAMILKSSKLREVAKSWQEFIECD